MAEGEGKGVFGWIWFFVKIPFWLIFLVLSFVGMIFGFIFGILTLPMRCCAENIIINNKLWNMVTWPVSVHKFFYGTKPGAATIRKSASDKHKMIDEATGSDA